jgi:methylated-DNA-[protein]-cysteine S-methyltransferase
MLVHPPKGVPPKGRRDRSADAPREARYDAVLHTPVCALGVRVLGDALEGVELLPLDTEAQAPATGFARHVVAQLERYLADPQHRLVLPVVAQGTPFQRRVWALLGEIPAGRVMTYGELARRAGTAPRAVGGACRANPLALVIPCHRAVGAAGLGGFTGATAGPALAVKRWLLAHEGVAARG